MARINPVEKELLAVALYESAARANPVLYPYSYPAASQGQRDEFRRLATRMFDEACDGKHYFAG
jgi:hypothetical protein